MKIICNDCSATLDRGKFNFAAIGRKVNSPLVGAESSKAKSFLPEIPLYSLSIQHPLKGFFTSIVATNEDLIKNENSFNMSLLCVRMVSNVSQFSHCISPRKGGAHTPEMQVESWLFSFLAQAIALIAVMDTIDNGLESDSFHGKTGHTQPRYARLVNLVKVSRNLSIISGRTDRQGKELTRQAHLVYAILNMHGWRRKACLCP